MNTPPPRPCMICGHLHRSAATCDNQQHIHIDAEVHQFESTRQARIDRLNINRTKTNSPVRDRSTDPLKQHAPLLHQSQKFTCLFLIRVWTAEVSTYGSWMCSTNLRANSRVLSVRNRKRVRTETRDRQRVKNKTSQLGVQPDRSGPNQKTLRTGPVRTGPPAKFEQNVQDLMKKIQKIFSSSGRT